MTSLTHFTDCFFSMTVKLLKEWHRTVKKYFVVTSMRPVNWTNWSNLVPNIWRDWFDPFYRLYFHDRQTVEIMTSSVQSKNILMSIRWGQLIGWSQCQMQRIGQLYCIYTSISPIYRSGLSDIEIFFWLGDVIFPTVQQSWKKKTVCKMCQTSHPYFYQAKFL